MPWQGRPDSGLGGLLPWLPRKRTSEDPVNHHPAEQCDALFTQFGRNIQRTPAAMGPGVVRCELPAGHLKDKTLGWVRLIHRSNHVAWNSKPSGWSFRYFQCEEVDKYNGGVRCVKFVAHAYGGTRGLAHESAEGHRWGGPVVIGPDPLSSAPKGVEPDRCWKVFAGRRCTKANPHDPRTDKAAYQHVVEGGDVWVIEHGRAVRVARGKGTPNPA